MFLGDKRSMAVNPEDVEGSHKLKQLLNMYSSGNYTEMVKPVF